MAWGTGGAFIVPNPPIYIPCDEPKGRPCRPRWCPLRHAGTKPPPPQGLMRCLHGRCRPLDARKLPVSAPWPSGPHQPFWAARDGSRRRFHRPASRESVRGLPDHVCRRRARRNPVRASSRDTLIGCRLLRSWWRITRSAPTHRDDWNLITGVCSKSL